MSRSGARDEYPRFGFRIADDCPRCGEALLLRRNRETRELFLGCGGYEEGCKFTSRYDEALQQLAEENRRLAEEVESLRAALARPRGRPAAPSSARRTPIRVSVARVMRRGRSGVERGGER